MTSIRLLWLLLSLLWISSEILLARRTRLNPSAALVSERSEYLLWGIFGAALLIALTLKALHWLPIPLAYLPRQLLALPLFAAGLYLRFHAVSSLGRLFTTRVAIQQQHELIQLGAYRWVRHPAYTGLLIAFMAAGLAMGDALALLILTGATFYALHRRIIIEEKLLHQQFGTAYQEYCRTTKRLIPGIY